MRARANPAGVLLLTFLCTRSLAASGTDPQGVGGASFRIFHRGALIGTTTVSLAREEDGWRLQGTGELEGTFQLTILQLDIRYDPAWQPRIMTMEIVAQDDRAVVHVAFGLVDGSTRTDIVRPTTASWGANQVAADTIPLPDLVFGAYEALAARLTTASPGQELRAFVVPRFEVPMSLDGVVEEAIPTSAGRIDARRWRATVRKPEGAVPMEIWVAGGRMVRLDLPKDGISVVRDDVIWTR